MDLHNVQQIKKPNLSLDFEGSFETQIQKLNLFPDFAGEINCHRFLQHQEILKDYLEPSMFIGEVLKKDEVIRCPTINQSAKNAGGIIALMIRRPRQLDYSHQSLFSKLPPSYALTILKILQKYQSPNLELALKKMIDYDSRVLKLFWLPIK